MCGPSKQQEQIAGQEQNFTTLLQSHYGQYFSAQSGVLQHMNDIFTPIAEAGPGQFGFTQPELAALQTQAGEGVGAQYSKASQALNTQLAARGGGGEVLPTGSEAALKGGLASAAAAESSRENLGITEAGYAQGHQNWLTAMGGLDALGRAYDPNAIAGRTTESSQLAFEQASQVQQMKNQKEAAIAGGVASLAMDAATFGAGALGGGGLSGGLDALTKGAGRGSGGGAQWPALNI